MLGASALVLWPFVILLPRRAWRHVALSSGARLFLRVVGTPVEAMANAPIPKSGILVPNHSSYLDAVVLASACPGELSFVAKQELADQIVAGPFLRRLGSLFVRRMDPSGGVADARAALAALRAGQRLVWFPEGTFKRMPGLLDFHMGAFQVASEAGLPVIPVVIRGTRSILRSGQWLPRRGSISVHIGSPLRPEGSDFSSAVRLRDATRAAILSRLNEPDLAGERPSGPFGDRRDAPGSGFGTGV
jgi:1-acyl-sn-glycerol-3-phosphate acyltransferase